MYERGGVEKIFVRMHRGRRDQECTGATGEGDMKI